jgi:hypothetical protein
VLSRGRQVGSIEPRRVRSRQSACRLTSAPQRTHTAPSCRLGERSEEASFATPGGKSGWFCHTPSVAAARALGARAVGAKRALELAMIGDAIDARTALDWGLRGSEALRTERAMDEPWKKLKTTPCKVGCYRPELFLNRARPAGKLSGSRSSVFAARSSTIVICSSSTSRRPAVAALGGYGEVFKRNVIASGVIP